MSDLFADTYPIDRQMNLLMNQSDLDAVDQRASFVYDSPVRSEEETNMKQIC